MLRAALGDVIFALIGRLNSTDTGPGPFYRDDDPLSTPIALLPGALRQNYHPAFDRGAIMGPSVWNVGPPNGSVTGTDIFAVLGQFHHSCA